MLELKDINSPEDVMNYIEGCLNDMEARISSKKITVYYIVDLIIHLLKKQSNGSAKIK